MSQAEKNDLGAQSATAVVTARSADAVPQLAHAEEWLWVVGYEGRYLVSSIGRVKTPGGRFLKLWKNDKGYVMARLSQPRGQSLVHRLVAQAFIPNPENKPHINHIDCDPVNNRVANLEWCTQKENLAHMDALGRRSKHWAGRRSPNASLEDGDVRQMREMHATGKYSWQKLGDLFGVSKRAVGRIVRGQIYADVR